MSSIEEAVQNHKPFYQHTDLSFSLALMAVENGYKLRRKGWNGKGMFIFLVPGSRFTVNRPPLNTVIGEGAVVDYHAHIDLRAADGSIMPWQPSQADMLTKDWEIVE